MKLLSSWYVDPQEVWGKNDLLGENNTLLRSHHESWQVPISHPKRHFWGLLKQHVVLEDGLLAINAWQLLQEFD